MKAFILSILSIFTLIGYVKVGANNESPIKKEDREFQQLMSDFHKTLEHNKSVQIKADETKDKIIITTTHQLVKLTNENKELKTELNEVKAILDSVIVDTGRSFRLLPISQNQKN